MPSTPSQRPASRALAGLGAVGTAPPSRQGTAKPATACGTPHNGKGTGAELGALAQRLILKLRARFGDAAADVKGQEIISQEVLAFVTKGVTVKEEDLSMLENRIRARLTGGTPVTTTLAQEKRKQQEGDEWACIFEFNVAAGKEKNRQEREELKRQQERVRNTLAAQMRERDAVKKAEQDEAMAFAQEQKAAYQAWQETEAARQRLQQEIVSKLRDEQAEQLREKNARRANAVARARRDDEALAARIAYETKTEFEKEEATRLEAKQALRDFLLANEANKAVREATKLAGWEEDAHYQAAWRDLLDKQDRERTERLQRNMLRQEKTAAYANSGVLPEYKKWIDPAITERQFREHEAKLDAEEKQRRARVRDNGIAMAKRLEEQMREREAAKAEVHRQDEAKAAVVLQRAAQAEAKEKQKQAEVEAMREKYKSVLLSQMKDNVMRKRYQPMSEVERSLNKQLLDKVHTWKQTGKLEVQ